MNKILEEKTNYESMICTSNLLDLQKESRFEEIIIFTRSSQFQYPSGTRVPCLKKSRIPPVLKTPGQRLIIMCLDF
ncbi:MAG: hypothetical protein CVU46_13805 [Chloroflexi bacterium HGW-Chloroflexi-8]|nr:MAG: hypothetical protein CVU46_13805 [Chloroflexi bacterium HGW-Chloroflexi-8]